MCFTKLTNKRCVKISEFRDWLLLVITVPVFFQLWKQQRIHEIIIFSDINHTSKGMKNMLYKLYADRNKDANKEFITDSIKNLHGCFTCFIPT